MPRTARLTDALRGRRTALAALGAAAALAGAGTASAATLTTTTTTTGHPATAHPAAAHPAAAHAARARHARRPAGIREAARGPARPYQIYDSVTPAAIPAHHVIATYATGGYAVTPAQVTTARHVLWIDTNGTDPRASVLDIEPGDATPAGAAAWTRAKLTTHPRALARLYTMRSEWPAVQAAVRTLPATMQTRIRWWIADPTGTPHIVPGAQATQWYWGPHYDITPVGAGHCHARPGAPATAAEPAPRPRMPRRPCRQRPLYDSLLRSRTMIIADARTHAGVR